MAKKKKNVQKKKNSTDELLYDDILELRAPLNNMNTSPISQGLFDEIMNFCLDVEEAWEAYMYKMERIMSDYGVEQKPNGIYQWEGHKKEQEINEKVNSLNNQKSGVHPRKIIEHKHLYKVAKASGLNVAQTRILRQYIGKKDPKKQENDN